MKLRTLDNLQDHLDSDFSWRIKEISDIKLSAKSAISNRQNTLIRAGVPLLYAHWEGFVKNSAEAYINFVAFQRLKLGELSCNFAAIAARNHIFGLTDSNKGKAGSEAIAFLRSRTDLPAELSNSFTVNTKSNLNSEVFEDIAATIGIDSNRYETKYNLMDLSLLKQRNCIAHGEYLQLNLDSYIKLSDEICILLRWVKNDIQNGASTNAFRYSSVAS
ncbi:MAG: hypothetical protein ACI9SP_004363 [Arenicella sp.]|jgi:hypothetical protein